MNTLYTQCKDIKDMNDLLKKLGQLGVIWETGDYAGSWSPFEEGEIVTNNALLVLLYYEDHLRYHCSGLSSEDLVDQETFITKIKEAMKA
jgi:hypothetical protein